MRKLIPLKFTALVLLLFFIVQSATAQQNRVVTGTLVDASGKGIPGVTVTVKGTNLATQTDGNGSYRINAPENATLVFSSVGFQPEEVAIGTNTAVSRTLIPTNDNLSEVVVIGYGTARKRDLTGSISTVTAKDFNKGTFASPDQLIQGKVAGLMIVTNSGQPGSAATVKIRGNATVFGAGQPLYVIDNIPLDNRSARPGFNASGIGTTPGGNPLNFINPADIASVDVLKDASATAIFGSRAADGVILITTKKGQVGPTKIFVNSSIGVASIMNRIDVLNAQEYREALSYYGLGNANDKGSDVNALDAILQKGTIHNHNISFSGGTETGRYRVSFGYYDQEGIVRKTGLRKYTASINGQYKFLQSKRL